MIIRTVDAGGNGPWCSSLPDGPPGRGGLAAVEDDRLVWASSGPSRRDGPGPVESVPRGQRPCPTQPSCTASDEGPTRIVHNAARADSVSQLRKRRGSGPPRNATTEIETPLSGLSDTPKRAAHHQVAPRPVSPAPSPGGPPDATRRPSRILAAGRRGGVVGRGVPVVTPLNHVTDQVQRTARRGSPKVGGVIDRDGARGAAAVVAPPAIDPLTPGIGALARASSSRLLPLRLCRQAVAVRSEVTAPTRSVVARVQRLQTAPPVAVGRSPVPGHAHHRAVLPAGRHPKRLPFVCDSTLIVRIERVIHV
jgi:hypothetical protein